ncbi:MAG: FAD-dependent oxidoreductase [Burkholderiaceae bacterium]|nr:FAD-dependent oxidoreductase [Burkholderiaceae bacterium]
MLLGTLVYVNAGTQLAKLDSLKGILSPGLLLSFVLLGVFPLIAKKIVDAIKARKVYAKWTRPAKFDRNLVVIGAGSAGLVSAYIAAAVKAKVSADRDGTGWAATASNTGCVPSKALIRSAKFLSRTSRAPRRSASAGAGASFDFAQVMERVQRVVQQIEPHDSVARYTGLGVECIEGEAKITSPWTVEVRQPNGTTRTLATKSIVIAAGARPFVPPIPGIDEVGYLTSDTVWNLRELPRRLVVLGGGPIGCELAQAFARLGSPGDAGGDAAAPHDPRRPGDLAPW